MSTTTNLKLFKHDNPSTNTNLFDVERALNENWDKIDEDIGKKIYYYDNVQEMKNDENLKEGMVCQTLGYYEANDGGSGLYQVIAAPLASVDEGSYIALDNNYIAKLINVDKYVNVLLFGAKGDGTTNNKTAISNAYSYANSNKYAYLYFPEGIFYTDESLPNYSIKGSGQDDTVIDVDISSGFAISINSYYIRPNVLEDITIKLHDKTKSASGLLVDRGAWGGSIRCERISLKDFTDRTIRMRGAYGSKFTDCYFAGDLNSNTKTNILLDIGYDGTDANTVCNENLFINCMFFWGKVGVYSVGSPGLTFIKSYFESLNLLLSSEQITGITNKINFLYCGFEKLVKGIINAKTDLTTLLPITPITGKTNVTNLEFNNCFKSGNVFPTNILDSTVNPYDYTDFGLVSGYSTGSGKKLYATGGTILNPIVNNLIADDNFALKHGDNSVIFSLLSGSKANTLYLKQGNVGINCAPADKLDIDGSIIRLRNPLTPTSSAYTGRKGQICWDSNYLYICIDTNTWKRINLSTW